MSDTCDPLVEKAVAANRSMVLDLLRGVAVVAVVLLHTSHHAIGHGVPFFDDLLWPVIRHFYLGVQLFFVISGYCIMGAVESAQRGSTPFVTYFHRRARRIYPPYWMSLVLLVGLGTSTVILTDKRWWDVFPLTATDWFLNLILLQQLWGAPDASLPFWSLSIEVQFYVLMAGCLLYPNWRSQWLMALSYLHILVMCHSPHLISGTGLAHWAEFACGIGVYSFCHPQRFMSGLHWQLWGATILAIAIGASTSHSIVVANGEFILPVKQAFCLVCVAGVLLLQRAESTIRTMPGSRSLAWLGSISFSLYLTHVPIASRVFNLTGRFLSLNGMAWCIVAIFAALLQVAVAWLFYRFCEAKWLNVESNQAHPLVSLPIGRAAALTGPPLRSGEPLLEV